MSPVWGQRVQRPRGEARPGGLNLEEQRETEEAARARPPGAWEVSMHLNLELPRPLRRWVGGQMGISGSQQDLDWWARLGQRYLAARSAPHGYF